MVEHSSLSLQEREDEQQQAFKKSGLCCKLPTGRLCMRLHKLSAPRLSPYLMSKIELRDRLSDRQSRQGGGGIHSKSKAAY